MKTIDNIKFGDILHLHGEKLIVICPRHNNTTSVVDKWGEVEFVVTALFDEFCVSPEDKFQEQVLKDWRSQSLDFAHETLGGEFVTTLEFMAEFMYRYGYSRGVKV